MGNENGSSLIVVLLVVAVFSILGLSLITLTASTTTQVSKTGNNLKATNVAEMGVVHLQEEIHQIVTTNNGKTLEELKVLLENNLPSNIRFQSQTGNTPNYRVVRNEPVKIEKVNNTDRLIIPFTISGYSNQEQKSITGRVIVKNSFPLVPVGVDPITGTPTYQKQGLDDEEAFDNTVYYSEGFSIASNFSLTYQMDLYSQGETTLVSNTDIWVKGDAYVNDLSLKTTWKRWRK
ncbi:hypothetical protein [Bacillus sp. T3]|uniref:hypothetical protein n=1 Tax=Bacillus sp. T3 TaxID=467262 RepID=UPI002982B4CC|nr:hypothetical protein [Bacillus sp. T3]